MKITAIWKNSTVKPQRRALTLAFTAKAHGKMASAMLSLTFQRTLKQPTVQQQNGDRNLCPSATRQRLPEKLICDISESLRKRYYMFSAGHRQISWIHPKIFRLKLFAFFHQKNKSLHLNVFSLADFPHEWEVSYHNFVF